MRPAAQQCFTVLCDRMKQSKKYELEIRRFWRSHRDKPLCTRILMQTRFSLELTQEEAEVMSSWLYAFFSKSSVRRSITAEEKLELWKRQKGICPRCGERMGLDMRQNHADHGVPFTYVGDELPDNLQLMHKNCNLSKGSRIACVTSDTKTAI